MTGKSFGELMPHFVLGGDETCFLASDGTIYIIGDIDKKKHEKNTADSRVSITIYRIGAASGDTGPTAFLPPGVKVKKGFTPAFLKQHGAAHGSCIVMTANGFMTEEAWLKMTPSMIDGIRNMPVIKNNPDWWVLLILDGFGAHFMNLEVNNTKRDPCFSE